MKTLLILKWIFVALTVLPAAFAIIRAVRHKDRQADKVTAIAFITAVFFAICLSVVSSIQLKQAKKTSTETVKVDTTQTPDTATETQPSITDETESILKHIREIADDTKNLVNEYLPEEMKSQNEIVGNDIKISEEDTSYTTCHVQVIVQRTLKDSTETPNR